MAQYCEEPVDSGGAEDAPPRCVAVAHAGILERFAERNDDAEAGASPSADLQSSSVAPPSAFRATARPGISVRAYAARIARFAGCSPACYVAAYAYLDRLLLPRRGRGRLALAVDTYSVHRLLTAVLVAVKFMDDV